jgi:hypothetical protein
MRHEIVGLACTNFQAMGSNQEPSTTFFMFPKLGWQEINISWIHENYAKIGVYSCRWAYMIMFAGQTMILGAPQLWKTRASCKCRSSCGCCCSAGAVRQSVDTAMALPPPLIARFVSKHRSTSTTCFFSVFSREVWFEVLQRCGWEHLTLNPLDRLVDWWVTSRKRVTASTSCFWFDGN